MTTRPLRDEIVGDAARPLAMMLAAGALLGLLALTNVATLMLVRWWDDVGALTVRGALGAAPSSLRRLVVAEGLVLGTAAAVLAVGLAGVGVAFLVDQPGLVLPRRGDVAVDGAVAWATAAAVVVGVLVVARAVASGALRLAGGAGTAVRRMRGGTPAGTVGAVRDALVAVQVAVALTLVAGTVTVATSVRALVRVDPGFDPTGVTTAFVALEAGDLAAGEAADFWRRLTERLQADPRVLAAGATTALPFDPGANDFNRPIRRLGATTAAAEAVKVQVRVVTPGYLEAMAFRTVAGRTPGPDDRPGAPRVAVANAALRRALGLGPDDRWVELEFRDGWQRYDLVGTVADARDLRPGEPARPQLFLPHAQAPYLAMTVAVRALPDVGGLDRLVRDAVAELRPDQPVTRVVSAETLMARASSVERFVLTVLSLFGLLAFLLALGGIYGMTAHAVAGRRREVAIRKAIGSSREALAYALVGRVALAVGAGLGAGALASLLTAGLAARVVYAEGAPGPAILVPVLVALAATAAVAAGLPARRALAEPPGRALRE